MDHTPNGGPSQTVLWAADTTNPERNRVPWRRVTPDLEIVEITGRHRGLDSIMGADRVEQITTDITRRLRP